MKVRRMCWIALMTALICVAAPFALPIGPIPISLAKLAIYLAGCFMNARDVGLSVALYILIGAAGVPVFAGFSGGLQKLAGMTGGYIVGFLPCAVIIGFAVDHWGGRKWVYPVSMVVATLVCYAVGTAWFIAQTGVTLIGALGTCVIPFLPGDAAKIVIATVLGISLRGRLARYR